MNRVCDIVNAGFESQKVPMKSSKEIAALRAPLIGHLEAALALSDETGDATARSLIESRSIPSARTSDRRILTPAVECPDCGSKTRSIAI